MGFCQNYDDITKLKQCDKLSANMLDSADASRMAQNVGDDRGFRPVDPSVNSMYLSFADETHDLPE